VPPYFDAPPPDDERRGSRWPWLLALLLALLIGGGIAAYLLSRPTHVPVPSVVGQNINNASTILQNDGFAVSTVNVANPKPNGTVIHQSPQPNVRATEGTTVTLTVSTGPGNVTVPGVVGYSKAKAVKMLTTHGLKVGGVVTQSSDSVARGDVISTYPAAGTSVPGGSAIELIVSSGRAKVKVPDVTGESASDAKAQLSADGFAVTTSSQTSSTATPGDVLSQNPVGGTSVAPGTTVNLVVASAPTTATVPDVRGQTAASAASQLVQAGFQVQQRNRAVSDPSQDGIVLSENPRQGTTQSKGTTVTIVVGKYQPPATTTGTTPTTASTPTTTTPTTTGTTPGGP
jgi:serine/threonine-protein kinase